MGQDQDHMQLIFLPGQADSHYQHLAHTIATVRAGDQALRPTAAVARTIRGGRDWHAKIYLRWLTAAVDDANGSC
jgi:hypothetical protein